MSPEPSTPYRLSATARRMLDQLAMHYGIKRTGVLEMLIREKARKVLPKEAGR